MLIDAVIDPVASALHHQQAAKRESDSKASIQPSFPKQPNSPTTTFGKTVSCPVCDAEIDSVAAIQCDAQVCFREAEETRCAYTIPTKAEASHYTAKTTVVGRHH